MPMEPILTGVRVIDMTQYLAGPTVTRLMAEMGADIIKIEQAPYGDPTRGLLAMKDGRSGYFVQQNRGKKSLCIDFDDPQGRRILDELLASADVLVENYGPGVLERRGLDFDSLHAKHPRLVMASISGFGRKGVYSHKTAFDLIAQAFSGFMEVTGAADGPPMPVGVSFADVSSGVHALAGLGMALYHRERTGRGQHVDIAMVDSLFHAHEIALQAEVITNGRFRIGRSGEKSSINAPQGAYKSPEGYVVLQVMQGQWPGFCRALALPELETDERFSDIRGRKRNLIELNRIIEGWMATMETDAEVLARLEAHRVPCAPVLHPSDAIGHPYFVDRDMVRVVPDPILGEVTIPGNPLKFSEQPVPLDLLAPLLGEHNSEILTELGYSSDDIARLHDTGVLRRADT